MVVILLGCAAVGQEELPEGWRKPTLSEANESWRRTSRTRFLVVRGDFDGDGKPDLAQLLVNDTKKELGLLVRLSSSGEWEVLHDIEIRGEARLGDFGIRRVLPRKNIETLCGSDPSSCASDTAQILDLSSDAIEFFAHGTSSTYFYWDGTGKKFRLAPMSD